MDQLLSEHDTALDTIRGEMLRDLETDADDVVLARFIARYAEHRQQIEQFWSDIRLVDEHLASTAVASDPGSSIALANDIGIPGHRIVRPCGFGSQGVVYEAIREDDQATVAIKVIRSTAASQKVRARFRREIRSLARLRHPHIVAFYSSGLIRDLDYFIMEFAGSYTLADVIARNSLSTREKLELFLQVLEGVEHAHENGVVHRDLKPSQILLDSAGNARVGDFGLASLLDESRMSKSSRITDTGAFLGTLRYCSPEQTRNSRSRVDSRSDIYSLGILLYEFLTGHHPYGSTRNPDSLLDEIRYASHTRFKEVDADVDSTLVTIALHAMHKLPSQRYRTARAFADDIRRYLEDKPIHASPMKRRHTMRLALSKRRWPVALGVAAGLTMAVGLFYNVRMQEAEGYTAAQARLLKQNENLRFNDVLVPDREPKLVPKESSSVQEAVDRLSDVTTAKIPISTLVSQIENPPDSAIVATSLIEKQTIVEWYGSHAPELINLRDLVAQNTLRFGITRASESSWLSTMRPAGIALANQMFQRLLGAAKAQNFVSHHSTAIGFLEAARSAAVDLGSSVTLQQRAVAVMQRQQLYQTALALMKNDFSNNSLDSGYLEWCALDPSLPAYAPALEERYNKFAQWLVIASTADSPSSRSYLELDRLPQGARLYFEQAGALTREFKQLARTTLPSEALSCLRSFYEEIQSWDDLTIQELSRRAQELPATLSQHDAWPIVRPLMSNPYPAFRFRARVLATRAATLLAARLLEYENTYGSWPATVEQLRAPLSSDPILDPYTGTEFGYLVTREQVVLYSINEDLIDNGANPGEWGQFGSDVVFLELPAPPISSRQILATKGVSAELQHP